MSRVNKAFDVFQYFGRNLSSAVHGRRYFYFLPLNVLLQHVCLSDVRFIIHSELNACVIGLAGHLILTVSVAIPISNNSVPH